jgi:conjugal transfer mating pair stabilization protein TraN
MNAWRLAFALCALLGAAPGTYAEIPCWQDAVPACSDGPSSRIINGLEVRRDCWNWHYSYTCGVQPISDACSNVRNTPGCSLSGNRCLTAQPDGSCTSYEYTYSCYSGGTPVTYEVCNGELFCSNGDCAQGSTAGPNNFTQGYGTFAAAREAATSFDATTRLILVGEPKQCRKQLNAAIDCCAEDGVLNGVVSCNAEEQALALANQARRTVYLGKFCSNEVLGACVEDKWTFCVFDSLLARIIHQQGRAQLGISFGSAEAPNCRGLTLEEFGGIDFALIDFSEFIATVSVPPPNQPGAEAAVRSDSANQVVPDTGP